MHHWHSKNHFTALTILSLTFLYSHIFAQETGTSKLIKSIVLVDSSYITIEQNGKTIAKLEAGDKKYFHMLVRYDNVTTFVSAIRCSFTIDRNHWRYEAIVWDYMNDETWVVTEGESGNSTNWRMPLVFRYTPRTNSGIINVYGSEWSGITFFKNEYKEGVAGFSKNFASPLCIIPGDRMVIKGGQHGEDTNYFYIYDQNAKILSELTIQDLKKYKTEILLDNGKNVDFRNSQPFAVGGKFFQSISWNPEGTAFVYTKYNSLDKIRPHFVLFDFASKSEMIIATRHFSYAMIWN